MSMDATLTDISVYFEFVIRMSQPIIALCLIGLVTGWWRAGTKAQKALDQVQDLSGDLRELKSSIDDLVKTMTRISESTVRQEEQISDLQSEMLRNRKVGHDHANHIQSLEVRVSIIESLKKD